MEDAAHTFADLVQYLVDLEPPNSPASPATHHAWYNLEAAAYDALPHIRRLFGHDAVRDIAPPAPRRTRRDQHILKRLEHVTEGLSLDALDVDEAYVIISQTRAGSRVKCEDSALRVLCRGYDSQPRDVWQGLLQSLTRKAPTLEEMRLESSHLDEVADIGTRLFHRHEYLTSAAAAHGGASWAAHVVRHIEALRFALDWSRIFGPGSQNIKTCFYQNAYSATIRGDIPPEADVHDYINTHKKREYHCWKRAEIEPVVTARNRLLALYNIFGAGVLIDTTWNLEDLARHTSRDFAGLLERLTDHAPLLDQVEQLRKKGAHTLLVVMGIIAGKETKGFVKQFLEENPPARLRLTDVQ